MDTLASSLAIEERTYPANSAESVSAYIAGLFCVVDVLSTEANFGYGDDPAMSSLVVLRGTLLPHMEGDSRSCPTLRKSFGKGRGSTRVWTCRDLTSIRLHVCLSPFYFLSISKILVLCKILIEPQQPSLALGE